MTQAQYCHTGSALGCAFAAALIKRRTVSVGCAPLLIQYCTRSLFRLISGGSRVGLYVPRFSRYAPSRFDCFSLTTMRYDGRFFAPVRINLIANKFFLLLNYIPFRRPTCGPMSAQVPPLNNRCRGRTSASWLSSSPFLFLLLPS